MTPHATCDGAVTSDAEKLARRIAAIATARPPPAEVDARRRSYERSEPRISVYRLGRIGLSGGAELNCTIVDQSASGARVQLDGADGLPDYVTLKVVMTGATRRARVVWRRGNSAGLSYAADQRASFGGIRKN